jgi:hypothetical protein
VEVVNRGRKAPCRDIFEWLEYILQAFEVVVKRLFCLGKSFQYFSILSIFTRNI